MTIGQFYSKRNLNPFIPTPIYATKKNHVPNGQPHAYFTVPEAAILLSAELLCRWYSPMFAYRHRFRYVENMLHINCDRLI